MPGQERLKDSLTNKFNLLVPGRSRSPSPTLDPQASSTSVDPDPTSIHDTQSLNSPSLSSIYPSIVIYPAKDEAIGRMADSASAGFQDVKTTLHRVERVADVSPLKSTVEGLLGIIDIMENQQDLQDLEQKLRTVVIIIDNHASYFTMMPWFITRLEGLSVAMNYQISAIKMKSNPSFASCIAAGSADAGDITVAYRTLSYLFDAFLMDDTLEIGITTHEILSDSLLNNLPQAKHAAYNAKSRAGRRSCTAKTREKILADLLAWAADTGDTSIYWLNGMAGTGKTTIAYTFCQILDNIEILGGSFFCSRLDTDDADLIFPTLAYELARHSTAASNSLLNALEYDRNVGRMSMRDQFLNLIVTPTNAASEDVSTPQRPLIIVIDALDECADQYDVRDVLTIIRQYSPTLPLKFLITSRPDRQIQHVFRRKGTLRYSKFILHEIEEDVVSADIAIYAKEELAIIAKGQTAGTPINGWPPEDRLNTLVHLSGTLFVYAATACKYVGGGGNYVERFEDITDISPNSPNSETSALDDLYGHILSDAFRVVNAKEKDEIRKVLRAIISVCTPLSVNGLSKLLKIKAEIVGEALLSLHPLVYIPEDMDLPISMFHTSFTDFITTEKRSGEHFLEPSKSHHMLGLHCLGLLQSSLMENICQLEGFSTSNTDVSPSIVKDQIPEALAYACVNWASHVANIKSGGEVSIEVWNALYSFFDEKLLQWFECLSLLARLDDALSSLQKLEAWVPTEHNLQNAVVDAGWFIIENFDLVRHHPRETYSSALVWLPEQSRIRVKYGDKRKSVWKVVIGLRKTWDPWEQVLQGHFDRVNSVAFSPDGNHVVSGSTDNTVHIWNVATGESEAELKGHSGSVNSVTFSPDGSHIVSGSDDNTMCIWNVVTGESEAKLKGYSDGINSIIFSPDGSRVVSGSNGSTVHIWNVATGELEAELRGHSRRVYSVIFSPDGNHILSGSFDNTVRIWNVATGKCEAELKGHSHGVNSIIFSPDGLNVLSPSFDNTVYIWNLVTGKCEGEQKGQKGYFGCKSSDIFSHDFSRLVYMGNNNTMCIWNVVTLKSEAELRGHSGQIHSVAFSPDGSHLASRSDDGTVRIWNVATGKTEAVLWGHSGQANSVVFSPDGSHVASESGGNTVRIWNVAKAETEALLKGHSDSVFSVVFSPDGSHMASGSMDHTVRIWNVAMSESEAVLKGHLGEVNSVAFSPDGSHVVSASADSTIRIWNIATGASSILADRALLQDGIYFHPGLKRRGFHMSPLLLTGTPSFHLDSPWIVHKESSLQCWLPPQYRNIQTTTSHTTLFCIGLESGTVLAVKFCGSDPPSAVLTY